MTNLANFPHKPIVSIVLPTYNGSKYIQEAIDSCLSQTYNAIELIIVDDCSTDATPEILDKIKDSRVKLIRNKINQRLPRSLNIGFRHSKGTYLTWTSDDNLYESTAIEQMASLLENQPEIGFVYANYHVIDENGIVISEARLAPPSCLTEYNCVNACFLYRREVYKQVGEYDPKAILAEDYDYWLRVRRRFQIYWLQTPLYYYRKHSETLTQTYGYEQQQEAMEAVRVKWIGPDPHRFPSRIARSLGRVYLDAAFDAHNNKDWYLRRLHLLRALRYDPRYLKQRGVRSLLFRTFARLITIRESGPIR
jgi:glycosyltransferase involved in cell wall biosynthesis